ncbi:hypothetical protein RND71_036195 [Anisodus tanguticus]|uniref:Uncharacterized protein n=1 Tax=Anisodus tanguticus TaxID=243964 RepID=A0AAE1R5P9_9SOLA|nr:hypothetical protein RND71_036195 [Anisodus tanguticus]
MHDPRVEHMNACNRVIRYLQETLDYGLHLYPSSASTLISYTDADWGGCPDTRRSTSGYCMFLGDNLVSWKSKKQDTLFLSSVEAVYRALRKVVDELVWLSRLFSEFTVPFPSPLSVYCDSQSVLHIAKNPVFYERTKYIEVDCHFVRNMLQDGLISHHHINTGDQLADLLTKALTGVEHSAVLDKLVVLPSLPT